MPIVNLPSARPNTRSAPGKLARPVAQPLAVAVLIGTLSIATLAACTPWAGSVSEPLVEAQTLLPDQWHTVELTVSPALDLAQWWRQFDDSTLTQLIEQGLQANNSIAAAEGRLRSARAVYNTARGAQLPSVDASAKAAHQQAFAGPAVAAENYSLGLDTAWELDLFGKLRGTTTAAQIAAAASEADLGDIQRLISADIALNYINLRDSQARLGIAQNNLAIQMENLQIVDWRNQAGLGNQLEVAQARTAVAQTKATIAPLEQAVATAIYQIDVLLGAEPGNSAQQLALPAPLPQPPLLPPLGLPADLLIRRPDVLSAQRALAAETIRIGVARADLYPALRLSGSLTTTSNTMGTLFDTSLASLVGGITAPIFQGGQIRARIEQQKGSADVALANYRSVLLTALQEVENALLATHAAHLRETALQEAETSALSSLELAEIRYRSGSIDFQTLLDVQRSLLSIQDSRASTSAARTTAAVQLFKALGGGWNTAQRPN